MKRTLKILSILVITILVMQVIMPLTANAATIENGVSTFAEEGTMKVTLKRDEVDSNTINITATDTTYNIEELKYVHKDIAVEDISYFQENNSDVYTFNITPSQNITESFEMDGYGTYTVYAKNSRGDMYLSKITIHDPESAPDITLIKDEEDPLSLTIQVISKSSSIVKLKIAKIEDSKD